MKPILYFSLGLFLIGLAPLFAQNDPAPPIKTEERKAIAVSSIEPEELEGFSDYSPALQSLVQKALELTRMNLGYAFGSSDPKSGGMDCSGSVYYVLQACGVRDVPRQSDEICRWVLRYSTLFRTESAVKFSDATFSALLPGDLVFWSGTYEPTTPRELPISHVMIYLGKRVKDHQPVLFGASDGRTYEGQRRNGVSIFDFSIPSIGSKSAIYGYGRIPEVKVLADEPEEPRKKPSPKPAKPKKKPSQRD